MVRNQEALKLFQAKPFSFIRSNGNLIKIATNKDEGWHKERIVRENLVKQINRSSGVRIYHKKNTNSRENHEVLIIFFKFLA